MTTLTIKNQIGNTLAGSNSLTECIIFIIHKPRTNTDILVENMKQVLDSVGSKTTITPKLVKASPSAARSLGLSEYLLLSNPITSIILHKPRNLLLNCTALTKSNFKFLPSHESSKYNNISNGLKTKVRYTIYVVKTRTMQSYNALEKLSNNSHLIPSFHNEFWRQMQLIRHILEKENEVVN